MAFKSRRIVTTHNEKGKAVVGADEVFESVPGVMDKTLQGVYLWGTNTMPADANAPDPRKGKIALAPPANGTVLRVLELPPGNHPHMHKTETVDYVIMLEGECDMILDDGAEVHMNQGDFMIQNATWHGWVNRSPRPCKIVFVLIDAKKS